MRAEMHVDLLQDRARRAAQSQAASAPALEGRDAVRLDRIEFDGYRNLTETVHLAHPLAVLVGPNNAGKSNVIDALRMTLSPLNGWPLRPVRDDFAHSGTGEPVATEMTISAHFKDLSTEQAGRMLTALDGSHDQAALHMNAKLPDVGNPRARFLGGEAKSPDIEDWARTAVTYTYLPPLRDAEEDMRPGRRNRLLDLVAALTGDGPDRQKILDIADTANADLSEVGSIIESRDRVQDRLNAIAGAGHAQQAALLFSEPTFERVLATLGVRVGDALPLDMGQNGLGLNNVLYMAVLLAALTHNPESDLHILLVEEPEAHLHPQLQDLLMRFLQNEVDGRDDVQVIVTTHSPNFASAARVERVTSMAKRPTAISPRAIGRFGLAEDELDHLARFLDVTKASLLFARAVILVEGLAEQLVLPLLAGELAPPMSLADSGVTIVNVGGLAFGPFAALYDEERLLNRCAIVSDSDPPSAKDEDPTGEEAAGEGVHQHEPPGGADDPDEDGVQQHDQGEHGDFGVGDGAGQEVPQANPAPTGGGVAVAEPVADPVLSATAQKLKANENACRKVFLSAKTFEHDLVMAGNWEWAIRALGLVKPQVAKRLLQDATLDTPLKKADAMLKAVDGVKGRFAQALTKTIEDTKQTGQPILVPPYIRDAIVWTCALPEPPDAPDEETPDADGAATAGDEHAAQNPLQP